MRTPLLLLTFLTCTIFSGWSQQSRIATNTTQEYQLEFLQKANLEALIAANNANRGGCLEGTLLNADSIAVCPGETAAMSTNGDEMIPAGGNYAYNFVPGADGTGGNGVGFSITLTSGSDYTFNAGLNGLLATNGLPDMAGTWIVSGFARDANGDLCSGFTAERPINWLPSGTPSCVPPDPCEAGTLVNTDSVGVCPGETVTITTNGDVILPTDGEYRMNFTAGPDGTGANGTGFSINVDQDFTFDAGINGILATNSLPDMAGTWIMNGFVSDSSGNPCSFSVDSKTVNWLPSGTPNCTPPDPCEAGTLENADSVAICSGETFTIGTNDDQMIPAAGGYGWAFLPGGDGTGGPLAGNAFVLADVSAPTSPTNNTWDNNLNGGLGGAVMEGTWLIRGFSYADSTDFQGSICNTTALKPVNFLAASNPACAAPCEAGTLVDAAPVVLCPWETTTIAITPGTVTIPTNGAYHLIYHPVGNPSGGFQADNWDQSAFTIDEPFLTGDWYYYGVVEDENGPCSYTDTLLVTFLDTMNAACDVCETYSIFSSTTVTDESIDGADDGAIDLFVSGGTEPYTFAWSNGAATEDISGLADGTYTVTITDANSCTVTASGTVIAGGDVCNGVTISGSTNVTDETVDGANDGAIDLTPSGGASPYTYVWSNGAITEDITGLTDGTYTVTITDANGCTGSASGTVAAGPDVCDGVTITGSTSVTDETVAGADDGEIDLTVSGGTAPYTFAWSNAETTEDITGLADGTYTVTITDANGCTGSASGTVTAGPDVCDGVTIALSFNVTDETIEGEDDGAIDLTVSGGTSPYTYAWSNSANTEDISGLADATYTVVVTDANGCEGTDMASVAPGTPVGILDIDVLDALNVYPVPAFNLVNLDIGLTKVSDVTLELYDVNGRQLQAISLGKVSTTSHALNLTDYDSGMYLIKVSIDEESTVVKVPLIR